MFFHSLCNYRIAVSLIDDTNLKEHLDPSNPIIYYDAGPYPNPSVAAATKFVPVLSSSLEVLHHADETVTPLHNQHELERDGIYQQQWSSPQKQLSPTQHHPIPSQPMVFAQPQQLSPTLLRQSQHFDVHTVTHNVQPVIASHSQLIQAPPQFETVPYHEDHSRKLLDSQITSTHLLLAIVNEAIQCSTCNKIFNRAVICHDYLIELNRPIQCACGCVLCTLCYRNQKGCCVHSVISSRGPINVIANNLASCSDLKDLGDWDLEFNADDPFKTEANVYVQQIIKGVQNPGFQELQSGRCIYLTVSHVVVS